MRRAPQLGQKPLRLQLKAARCSARQDSQRTRKKPCSNRPHLRSRRQIPRWLEDGEHGLSDVFRRLLAESYARLQGLDAHIAFYDAEIARHSQQDDACRRLQTIPGYGPVLSSAFYSQVGHGEAYRRGRAVSAAVGLVPR